MIKKANICYQPSYPGWSIGQGYHSEGISVCYSDGTNGVGDGNIPGEHLIPFDPGYLPENLKWQWVNLTVVFDTTQKLVTIYVNGKKQSNTLSISAVTGSVSNTEIINIWRLHGWVTDGQMDEIRIYNRALSDLEAQSIYSATR